MKLPACESVPARLSLGILTALGVMILYMMRINMSVAIVAMVEVARHDTSPDSQPSQSYAPYCIAKAGVNESSGQNGGVEESGVTSGEIWHGGTNDGFSLRTTEPSIVEDDNSKMLLTGAQKGFILGSFFYGYTLTNIPGGRMAEIYGTKKVFGGAILFGGLLTLLTPLAAKAHYILLIALRTLIGISNGVVYPSLNAMVARWIPPLERPRFMSITYMCNAVGTVVTMPVCGLLIAWFDWPSVFYFSGGVSLIWVLFWFIFMYDTPDQHPRISEDEKHHIMQGLKEESNKKKPSRTPWRSIMTSVPLWATTFAHIGSMFGFNLLLTQLPTYMATILGFSITSNGFLSALPFLTQFIGSTVTGFLGDWMITKGYITIKNSRRLFATVSLCIPGVVLVIVGYIGCDAAVAVALLCVGTACAGAICSGHLANHLDLAPNFAGTLYGVSNTVAFLVTTVVPIIVGAMTSNHTLSEWQSVFWLAASVWIVNWIIFIVFLSTDIQPWNSEQITEERSSIRREEDERFLAEDKA